MKIVIDISDDTANVDVICDGKRHHCTNDHRYDPGYWNGLNGGTHYGQYFDMDNVNRVNEMIAVAIALNEYGVRCYLSKLKRRYRMMITAKDFFNMDETLKERIRKINKRHDLIEEVGKHGKD